MNRFRRFCSASSLAMLAACSSAATAAELIALTPMMAGNKPLSRPGPKSERDAPVLKRAPADALSKAIALEATRGAVKFMVALDDHAQRLAGATAPKPTYLLRSTVEGGFARTGFWLGDTANNLTWHAEPFVDLVVDKASIDDGSFEEIFAHEMGHVLLRRLLPKLPYGPSRAAHSSLAITDYPTAFDEGFAIHFQVLARQLSQNPKLKSQDRGLEFKPFLQYWRSNLDRDLRIRGVRENLFVHQQTPSSLDVGDASAQFDLSQLKNGQQMLSSEGVVATLFYHLMNQSSDSSVSAERYRSLLISLRALSAQKLSAGTPIFLNLVQAHTQRLPDARTRWTTAFVNLTYGATMSQTVVRDFPKLAAAGIEGRTTDFQSALKQARSTLTALIDQGTKSPQRLGAALGNELWLALERGGGKIVTLNLNTAGRTTLMNDLGLDSLDVDLLLADRANRGPFASIDDFAQRRNAAPLLKKQLLVAQELARKIGGFQRS